MKRNLNKAFTLIELLAVIVILAIIALIATPIILGIVEDARKDSFERSVELVISTTDLDVANKNIQDGYTYEITDGTIPELEIGIKNIEGMNGTIVYDKEGKEQYAIHNGQYCVMKTEGMDKAVISDYEEGSCKLVIPTDSKYFTYREITEPIYKIIDKEACQTVVVEMGILSEDVSIVCNNEPYFNGMTLTEFLASDNVNRLAIKELLDAGAISYTGPEYEIVDKDACQEVYVEMGLPSEQVTSFCNNEPMEGMTLIEALASGIMDPLVSKELLDAGAIRITNVQLEITGYSEDGPKNVIIPSTIDGKTVVSIGNYAFTSKNLTSVKFPSSVTSIGNYAFANNKLSGELDLSNVTSLTRIGIGAFEGESGGNTNQITSVKFPKNIERIESNAFGHNQISGMLDLRSYANLTYVSGFFNNEISSIQLPEHVVAIGEGAFARNNISGELDLKDLVELEIIGELSFSYASGITSIKLPANVTSIGDYAFGWNSDGNTYQNLTLVTFYGRSDLTGITVPSSAFFNSWITGCDLTNCVRFVNEG